MPSIEVHLRSYDAMEAGGRRGWESPRQMITLPSGLTLPAQQYASIIDQAGARCKEL